MIQSVVIKDGTEYSNIRKLAEYSKSKIIFDFFGGENFIQLKKKKKKNPYKNLSEKCPGKIVDLTKNDHRGNTLLVCV